MIRTEQDLRQVLEKRIQLLSRGITPDIKAKPLYAIGGTGTGAGPQGTKFHMFVEGAPAGMISIPVYREEHHLSEYSIGARIDRETGMIACENGVTLRGTPIPKFVSAKLANGTPLIKEGLAGIHCYNTYTTVPAWQCVHAVRGEECRYCEINSVAREMWNWPAIVPIADLVEALQIVQERENLRSITMTTGTFADNDAVVEHYIGVATALREVTDFSIHIQCEPVTRLGLLDELSRVVDSVGIFLEIFDDATRKEICPGKSRNTKETYYANWERAVECFGRGNVTTTCLLGFGEEYDALLREMEDICAMGVIPSILFARFNARHLRGKTPSYLGEEIGRLTDFHVETARIMTQNGLRHHESASGCIGCQGCSAMKEAARLVAASEKEEQWKQDIPSIRY